MIKVFQPERKKKKKEEVSAFQQSEHPGVEGKLQNFHLALKSSDWLTSSNYAVFIYLFIYLFTYLFICLFIYLLSFWCWAAGAQNLFMGVPFETLFGGFLDFESNLTRTLHQHKSVEIEVSKTDMTLRYNTTLHLQQGNLKATRTFYLQAHS